jgi:ComF family protein
MASLKQIRPMLAATVRLIADIAYPPRCPSCRADVQADGNFCADCFGKLRMIAPPLCSICGIPFIVAVEEGAHCPECLETPPEFDRARSVMVYDAISTPLVTALKFNDQWAGVARYVQMMVGAGSDVLKGADMLVPVPLHWRRLAHRKFNQAAVLAYGISAQTGVPCAPHLLRRILYTKPQMRLDRATRLRNVRRAFAVTSLAPSQLRDKIVVLVDDVVTTGATADACAKVLKAAGAKEVRVLALARTVKE